MKRFAKMIVAGLLLASVSTTAAFADYNKGFKYYQKYVKKTGVKGTTFLKLIGVQTPDQLAPLMKDNAKPLIAKLNKVGKKDVAKAIEKIIKKHKLKDLNDFLVGMLNGKIPAG